jgi:hypothetical protein
MNNQLLQNKSSNQIAGLKVGALVSVVVLVVVLGLAFWMSSTEKKDKASGNLISSRGLHWHPELAIYVKGVKQEIPTGIGLGAVEMGMHTHDSTGVIHLELQGTVLKEDIMLGKFFKNWGKDFKSFGSTVTMTVNGKDNTEFENYVMHDKDKIELHYK